MSGASPTRAAVFTSSPQSVEIYERGAWWPGSMLGWRHDSRGRCQAWVRVEFAGVVEDAWVDLALLRLPESRAERHLTLTRQPKGAAAVACSERDTVLPAAQDSVVTQTQHLPLVRDGGAPAAGRRVPPTGGRRRAPETGEQQAVPAAPPAADSRPLGRHRAPAEVAGRHRATDTGLLGAVAAEIGPDATLGRSPEGWAPPPPRSELPPAGPVVRPESPRPESPRPQVDADLFTRPMRLDEGVGTVRRSRRDSLTGV